MVDRTIPPSPWEPARALLGCCVDRPYGTGCTTETCMHLPVVGQTCRDCAHVERCCAIFGQKPTDTSCQWFPRRFVLDRQLSLALAVWNGGADG